MPPCLDHLFFAWGIKLCRVQIIPSPVSCSCPEVLDKLVIHTHTIQPRHKQGKTTFYSELNFRFRGFQDCDVKTVQWLRVEHSTPPIVRNTGKKSVSEHVFRGQCGVNPRTEWPSLDKRREHINKNESTSFSRVKGLKPFKRNYSISLDLASCFVVLWCCVPHKYWPNPRPFCRARSLNSTPA